MSQHSRDGDSNVVFADGDKGCKRLGEIKRIDFFEAQLAILKCVQELSIGSTSRAEGFYSECMAPVLT